MNKIVFSFLFVIAMSTTVMANEKASQLKSFLSEIITISEDQVSGAEPIGQLDEILIEKADKTVDLTKESIVENLNNAKNYKHFVILVGRHTIVKITNLDDCRASGAWGTCMPMGTALIQKSGVFSEKTDYINNLIGIPDEQERKMFFFK